MQEELFKAQTAWFHVFKSMVDSGDVAAMGPGATTVYLVIKAYSNWKDGRSFPSLKTLQEKTGLSKPSVIKHLRVLEEHGYISRDSGKTDGRVNKYTLREKVVICTDADEPAAVATWDYLPSTVKAAVAELRNVALKGDFDGVKLVNIERLQINIGQYAEQVGVQLQSELAKLPKDIRTAVQNAITKAPAQNTTYSR